GKGNNILVPDPAKAEIVRTLFAEYATGARPQELCRRLKIPRASFWVILRNPVYIGRIRYGGRQFPGKHQPILDPDLWNRIQARLPGQVGGKPRPGAQKYGYLMAGGMVECACGRTMSPGAGTGRGHRRYSYYVCTDPACGKRVSAPQLEKQVLDLLSTLPPADIEKTIRKIRATRDKARAKSTPELHRLAMRQKELEADLAKIDRAFLDGKWTMENKDYWNERLATGRHELATCIARQSYLVEQQESPLSPYAVAEDRVRELPNMGALIKRIGSDTDGLRRFLASYLLAVRPTPEALTLELVTSQSVRLSAQAGYPFETAENLISVMVTQKVSDLQSERRHGTIIVRAGENHGTRDDLPELRMQ
ncbi:MAG: recombinase family protein, partial [Acidobacteriales bacterium]|nr:recombinase family protein [Terriglobales bacterium]